MKKTYVVLIGIIFGLFSLSTVKAEDQPESDSSVSIGFLHGGGALIGMDYEQLLTERFGVLVGAGMTAFGGGITYHFKPTIRSGALYLGYQNQGTHGDDLAQRVISATYLYKGRKNILTWQLGIAHILEAGTKMKQEVYKGEPPSFIFWYSAGLYFDF